MENGRRRRRSGLDDHVDPDAGDDELGSCLHSRTRGITDNLLTDVDADDDDDDRFLADVEAEVDELAVVSGRKGVGSHHDDQGGNLMIQEGNALQTYQQSVGEEEEEEEENWIWSQVE
eukprot:TRINITY_DN2721_c1_g2_i1.p1 TRINITY_DN2721_c1_g2~~TRINITY_DN2721_c1_g2_i1.p1  ORF type:complete len:118 (+),score=49.54 TRINITY_DN2721_c1_g2_i1:105-458(+)